MADSEVKYFDYLPEYGRTLQQKLGRNVEIKKIEFWRRNGLSDVDSVTGGCRKFAEQALNALSGRDPDVINMRLKDKIEECENRDLIDRALSRKLHEIRKKGNNGVHQSVNAYDARMSLELLDDLLRFLLHKWEIDVTVPLEAQHDLATIFYAFTDEDAAKLNRKAKTAALISGDKKIEKETKKATEAVRNSTQEQATLFEEMAQSILRAQETLEKAGKMGLDKDARAKIAEMQEALFETCDKALDETAKRNSEANSVLEQAEQKIDEILSEEDYIHKLLSAGGILGKATDSQFEVMAFPRTAGAVTNVLALRGAAGTGKTLCLLAKLISDVRPNGQMSLAGMQEKKALFLCFNKSLAGYVRGLMKNYSDGALPIEVAHYDQFVNQLIKESPSWEFPHLSEYASNVRYSKKWSVIYSTEAENLVKEAMGLVAKQHPEQANAYYLKTSVLDNVQWVAEEIRWLDARYQNAAKAADDYPSAVRTGRAAKRRPNADIRRIILEIWSNYERLLAQNQRYTVEQTTKLLLKADSLPAYDSIAVDEVQDFTMASIRLILKFRRSDKSRLYISGDENQKIYQRDFNWNELDEGVHGYTITLQENKRNADAILRFAERLNGKKSTYAASCDNVHVSNKDDGALLGLINTLRAKTGHEQKTVVIGDMNKWEKLLKQSGIETKSAYMGSISEPGIYVISELTGKGLEFDNVIVDYDRIVGDDDAAEKRLRYVHFTRARRRLYIRYEGEPPALLKEYYPDFLPA